MLPVRNAASGAEDMLTEAELARILEPELVRVRSLASQAPALRKSFFDRQAPGPADVWAGDSVTPDMQGSARALARQARHHTLPFPCSRPSASQVLIIRHPR